MSFYKLLLTKRHSTQNSENQSIAKSAAPAVAKEIIIRSFPFVIGRSKESSLKINSDQISRKHLEIISEGNFLYLIDHGSANGTFVNGSKIDPNKKTQYQQKTLIRLGDFEFDLQIVQSTDQKVNLPSLNTQEKSTVSGQTLNENREKTDVQKRIETKFSHEFSKAKDEISRMKLLAEEEVDNLIEAAYEEISQIKLSAGDQIEKTREDNRNFINDLRKQAREDAENIRNLANKERKALLEDTKKECEQMLEETKDRIKDREKYLSEIKSELEKSIENLRLDREILVKEKEKIQIETSTVTESYLKAKDLERSLKESFSALMLETKALEEKICTLNNEIHNLGVQKKDQEEAARRDAEKTKNEIEILKSKLEMEIEELKLSQKKQEQDFQRAAKEGIKRVDEKNFELMKINEVIEIKKEEKKQYNLEIKNQEKNILALQNELAIKESKVEEVELQLLNSKKEVIDLEKQMKVLRDEKLIMIEENSLLKMNLNKDFQTKLNSFKEFENECKLKELQLKNQLVKIQVELEKTKTPNHFANQNNKDEV